MFELAQPQAVSYSVRVCRRCATPMERTGVATNRQWRCQQCGRTEG